MSFNNIFDPLTVGGNITARLSNALPTAILQVGGLFEISMPASTDVQIRALAARQAYILSEGEYPGGSFSTSTAAIVNVTSTFAPADNNVHVAGERNTITIQDVLTGRIFKVVAWRFGAITGNWSGWCEEIGTTTDKVMTPGYGISIDSNQIFNSNRIAKTAPIASAQAGTTVSLGELSFRYSSNVTNGNLEVQSASTTAIPLRVYAQEYFPTIGINRNMAYFSFVAPVAGAAWTEFNAGGLAANEMLQHEIFTATNVYQVRLYSFGVANVHLIAEKAF